MAMAAGAICGQTAIKIEESPEPEPMPPPPVTPSPSQHPTQQQFDPKDPEGFLRRCSGINKKKGVRCGTIIGRNSHHTKNAHSTFLPTCYVHKDQQSYAGWCQFMQKDGERCGRLFRWNPPYFELCTEHQGHPDTPCYFLKLLPLEIRYEIFRYLLPTKPIGSSTSPMHWRPEPSEWRQQVPPPPRPPRMRAPPNAGMFYSSPSPPVTYESVFPMPLLNLLLVNRQVRDEVKDLLFSVVPFIIDVRKDGTYMCGRRLLEPRKADGSSHFVADEVEYMKEKFLQSFDWAAVKNYNVDILVENGPDERNNRNLGCWWDEEVELYDIRDYLGVVVSGILSKARNLCKLNVRVGFSRFKWPDEKLLTNVKTLVGPFERLRNVRQPRLCGIYESTPWHNCKF